MVRVKCEQLVAKQISSNHEELDVWVASRQEMRYDSKNRKDRMVDVVLLPAYVFFRFPKGAQRKTKYEPLLAIRKLNNVYQLVMEPNHEYGEWEGAHIPAAQIERLKFVLEMSDKPVDIYTEERYVKGDTVRVVRGSLRGLEGTISRDDDGRDRIYIAIDKIGYAATEISRMDVELIRRRPGRPRKEAKPQ